MPTVAPRLRTPSTVAAGAATVLVALLVRDPHQSGSWGGCVVLQLTGQPCPLCGGLRAVNDLLHGEVPAAVSSNAYAVLTVLVGGLAWASWVRASAADGRPRWARRVVPLATAWLLGLVVFGMARLLPGLEWLRP